MSREDLHRLNVLAQGRQLAPVTVLDNKFIPQLDKGGTHTSRGEVYPIILAYMLVDRAQFYQDAINTVTLGFWLESVSDSKKFVHDFVTNDSCFPDICRACCTHECCSIPKQGTHIRRYSDLDGVHRRVFFNKVCIRLVFHLSPDLIFRGNCDQLCQFCLLGAAHSVRRINDL